MLVTLTGRRVKSLIACLSDNVLIWQSKTCVYKLHKRKLKKSPTGLTSIFCYAYSNITLRNEGRTFLKLKKYFKKLRAL